MKILIVLNRLDNSGGVERATIRLANLLSQFYNVHIISFKYGKSFYKVNENVNVSYEKIETKFKYISRLEYIVKAILRINKYKRKNKIEVILACDIICSIISVISNIFIKTKLFGIAHSPRDISKSKLSYFYKKLDKLIVLTKEDEKKYRKIGVKATTIPNFLSFSTSKQAKLENKKILSIGRFVDVKNYFELIKNIIPLLRKQIDWKLEIVGEGPLRLECEKLIEKEKMGNQIKILNFREDVIKKYIESSMFVLASKKEAFGLVLTEAMECGLPCVSFDSPYGPRNIIKDNVDGCLVENGNYKMLNEKIKKLMNDEKLRKEMGLNSKKNVKIFSEEVISKKWKDVFESV